MRVYTKDLQPERAGKFQVQRLACFFFEMPEVRLPALKWSKWLAGGRITKFSQDICLIWEIYCKLGVAIKQMFALVAQLCMYVCMSL